MGPAPRPPRLAAALLQWLTPEQDREFTLGDLEEGFLRLRDDVGATAAKRWYWGQVLSSLGPLLTYSQWGWDGEVMTGFTKDVRAGLRQFYRAPGFSLVVVATIAIGVGGATAVFSVLRGVVLTPLSLIARPEKMP